MLFFKGFGEVASAASFRSMSMETLSASVAKELDPVAVTPGPVGFIVTLLLAGFIILLGVDMSRRVRRARYREQIRQQRSPTQAEPAEPAASTPASTPESARFDKKEQK